MRTIWGFLFLVLLVLRTQAEPTKNFSLLSKKPVTKTSLSGTFWQKTAYNDPCVIKIGNTWYMYLSRNTEDLYTDGRLEPVSCFYATSKDGVNWDLCNEELVSLGSKNDWDYNKVETPSVVFFNNQYHLYYSGASQHTSPVSYSIGHALSDDGCHWSKCGKTPVIDKSMLSGVEQVVHVAEPGAIVFNNKIYLYFVVTRIVGTEAQAQGKPVMELYLAVSDNAYDFSAPQKVLSQSENYPSSKGYSGYSTPFPFICNSHLELIYDVFCRTENNINPYEQVALQRAVSRDGINFIETPLPLLRREDTEWTKREIRGGSVFIDKGIIHMWFSGDNYTLSGNRWSGEMSICYIQWKQK